MKQEEDEHEIPMGRGIIAEMEAAMQEGKKQATKYGSELTFEMAMAAAGPGKPEPESEPAKTFTPDISKPQQKQVQLTRAEKRLIKRGGGAIPGNNKKHTKGRAIRQESALGFMKVGEEPRLVTVATYVRGKGGKKKVVLRKTLLSRGILATSEAEQKRVLGAIGPDENDSIKNSEMFVVGVTHGRVKNA